MLRSIGLALALTWFVLHLAQVPAHAQSGKEVTYDDHVATVFKRHCGNCHGEAKQKGGLDLSSYASVLKGGSGGPVVVPGRASTSRLVALITAQDPTERMPPENDPIPSDQIALITSWIDNGLRQNAGSKATAPHTPGFSPAPMTTLAGPVPMPNHLPPINRVRTVRPFPVLAMAASPRAPLLAVASYECIDLIDSSTHERIGALPFPPGEPHVLRFTRSGAVLLAAGGRPVQNGSTLLFDISTGKKLAELGDEPDVVIAADISPDERSVAIGGPGRVVKIYSTESGKRLHTLVKHTDWITAIAYAPDGKLLASSDRTGNIHLWDAKHGGVVLPLSEHKGAVQSLAWRSDSKVMVSCGEDGQIIWWDVANGWPSITKSNAHPPQRPPGIYGKIANGVLDAAFGHSGEVFTCGRDRVVRVWSEDGRERKAVPIDPPTPTSSTASAIQILPTRVAVTFDGKTMIAGDSSGQIHYWSNDKIK